MNVSSILSSIIVSFISISERHAAPPSFSQFPLTSPNALCDAAHCPDARNTRSWLAPLVGLELAALELRNHPVQSFPLPFRFLPALCFPEIAGIDLSKVISHAQG
jgi:hypothetical protein